MDQAYRVKWLNHNALLVSVRQPYVSEPLTSTWVIVSPVYKLQKTRAAKSLYMSFFLTTTLRFGVLQLISRAFKCVFIYTIAEKVSFPFINQKVAMIILITWWYKPSDGCSCSVLCQNKFKTIVHHFWGQVSQYFSSEDKTIDFSLKVHKNENFFGYDFEICTVSLLVMLKYEGFVKFFFWLGHEWGRYDCSA